MASAAWYQREFVLELREESVLPESTQLAIVAGDAELRGPWSLREWVPCPGYFAALAWRPK